MTPAQLKTILRNCETSKDYTASLNLKLEETRVKIEAVGAQNLDGMPKSPTFSAKDNSKLYDELIALEKQLNTLKLCEVYKDRLRISLIALVETKACRDVLSMKHHDNLPWSAIRKRIPYSRSNVFNIYNKGINEILASDKFDAVCRKFKL